MGLFFSMEQNNELNTMDIMDIMEHLPHRYPFLMVDRILELDPKKKAVGIKNVTINEPFFNGHFRYHCHQAQLFVF